MSQNKLPLFVDSSGLWCQSMTGESPAGAPRPALFLDRDGVVVEEVNYLHRVEDVKLIPGAAPTIHWANGRGVPVVIVTNQSGIGRRYYDWDQFAQVQERMISLLERVGAHIDGVFACPFHADGRPPYVHEDHPARKPNPGMLEEAARSLNLDLAKSWIVGDRAIDLRAGRNGGCAGGLQVGTGHGARDDEKSAALALAEGGFQVFTGENLADALTTIPLLADPPLPSDQVP